MDSIKIYDELKDLHSKNRGVDWKVCLKDHLQVRHTTLYHYLIKEANRITKINIMKGLKSSSSLDSNNIRLNYSGINNNHSNIEVDDEETICSDKNLNFLKKVLKKGEMDFVTLFGHLVTNDSFKITKEKNAFTYVQLKGQNEHDSKRESLKIALDFFNELNFVDENNGDKYYFYDPDE